MTAYSMLSELIMSFGPYAGAKTQSPSIALSVEGCAKWPTVPQRRELVTDTHAA